ncbi:hypothetical protein BH09BAC4_BH09BAC4_18330 [soil metagenome]
MKVEVKQNIIHALISGSLFISLVIMLLSAHEYYVVSVKKDKADYHFSNEHSMEEGDSHYESATSYSQSMLCKTITFLLITVVLCFGILKKRLGFFVIAGVIFLGSLLL